MGIPVTGQVGTQSLADGTTQAPLRQGRTAELVVSELHGRFYEQTFRGNLYTFGINALTALSANTLTLTATTTPILGVWNPLSSGVNLVILQASLNTGANNTATVGAGAFVWAASTGNGALTLGSAPFNAKSLTNAGSQTKTFTPATALTGLTNNLVIVAAADFPEPTIITTAAMPATIQTPTVPYVQNIDGAFIVPPGGVFALLNTISSTTVSVYGRMLFEEVPI